MSDNPSADVRLIVKVDENDNLTIDGAEKKIEELKPEFFEELVDKALIDKVDFVLEDKGIVSNFFKTIKDGTAVDSDLRKLYLKACANDVPSDDADSGPSNESGSAES